MLTILSRLCGYSTLYLAAKKTLHTGYKLKAVLAALEVGIQ